MVNEALGDDRRHEFVGVVDALAAADAQREPVAALPSDIAPIRGMNLTRIRIEYAWSLPRKRKKDGAYPFAPLSFASAGCLVGEAVGRLRATARRIAARRREEAEPEGSPATASRRPMLSTADVPAAARERRSPPTDALSPSPNWRLRRSARLGRSVLEAPSPFSVGPT